MLFCCSNKISEILIEMCYSFICIYYIYCFPYIFVVVVTLLFVPFYSTRVYNFNLFFFFLFDKSKFNRKMKWNEIIAKMKSMKWNEFSLVKYDRNPFDMGLFSEALKLQVAKLWWYHQSPNHQMFEHALPRFLAFFPQSISKSNVFPLLCVIRNHATQYKSHNQFLTCY